MRCRTCSPDWGHDQMTASTTRIGSFADVPLHGERSGEPATEAAVAMHVEVAAAAHGYTPDQLDWATPEGIDVKRCTSPRTGMPPSRPAIRWTASPASRRTSAV